MPIVSSLTLYNCCIVCVCHLLLHRQALGAIALSSTTSLHSSTKQPPTPTIPYFATTTTTTSSSSSNREPIRNDAINSTGERNGLDPNYPWRFEGRFIFRPSLVRINDANDAKRPPHQSAKLLSLFGYSLGGTVVLEYDTSPVGPYREYVTMGGVVAFGNVNVGSGDTITEERTLGIGQWGTDLHVSTKVAEDVCHYVWGVPAQLANIEFVEGGNTLHDYEPSSSEEGSGEGMRTFRLSGWGNARILNHDAQSAKRYGNLPIYWTPTIKALWAPILFPGRAVLGDEDSIGRRQTHLLPLHKLRLSASAIRLKSCRRQMPSNQKGEVTLGFALVVDNVLIEIGERVTSHR